MTQLSKTAFETKYNDATTGLFKTGQNRGIGSDDVRTLVTDIKDSFSNEVDSSVLTTGVLSLTSTQILSSNTTPISLVAAPGASKLIMPIQIVIWYDYATAYGTNTDITIGLGSGAFYTAVTSTLSGFLASTNDTRHIVPVISASFSIAAPLNYALLLKTSTGDPTGGTSTIKVEVVYKLSTLS